MIWMTWRQFRTQAVIGAAALVGTAIYLIILGTQIRQTYDANLALCQGQAGGCQALMVEFTNRYQGPLQILGGLLVVVPGLLGIFWGAPLVARELEAGTHRLVWNQSLTRHRWLVVKLLVVGVAGMAVAGLFSLLLTWAASPYDLVAANRFTSLMFGARNLAPVAYAAFALVLGTSLGLLVRRTVPAMALTVLVFAVVQIAVPSLIRPHLGAPVTESHPVTAETIDNLAGPTAFLGNGAEIGGLRIPDAWIISNSRLLASNGQRVDLDRYHDCIVRGPDATAQCLGNLNLHVQVTYQPGDRYWDFQWRESAIFLALSLLLAGLGLWRIRRRLS